MEERDYSKFQSKNIEVEDVDYDSFYKEVEELIKVIEPMVESYCGRCAPCRVGNKRLLEKLEKLLTGKTCKREIKSIMDLCLKIIESCLCPIGKKQPNMILDMIENRFIVCKNEEEEVDD